MATIRRILEKKGHDLWSIAPDETVYKALELLAGKDIGGLPVIEDGKVIGMFTEREYARRVALKGKTSKKSKVREMMRKDVYYITPDKDFHEAMALMNELKIRYLLVMDDDKIVGLVSIGDVVKRIMEEQKTKIQDLESYIMGSSYA